MNRKKNGDSDATGAIYVFFGVAWVFPLKPIFKGVGQPDPDDPDQGA